jgi:hypothetical protein
VQVVDAAQQLPERRARVALAKRPSRQDRPQQLPSCDQLRDQVDAPALGKVLAEADDVGVGEAAEDVDLLEDVLAVVYRGGGGVRGWRVAVRFFPLLPRRERGGPLFFTNDTSTRPAPPPLPLPP